MKDAEKLKRSAVRRIGRLKKAEREGSGLGSISASLGVLGLLVIVPVVGGAYLGVWLDNHYDTYGWTPTLIVIGVCIGAWNTFTYLR